MRIGIDIRALQGINSTRGIGRVLRTLLRDLWNVAPQHSYILFTRQNAAPCELPPHGEGDVHCVSVPTPPIAPHLRTFRFANLRHRYLRRMRDTHRAALARAVREASLDVLHLPHLGEDDYFADAGLACPTIATLYDLIPLVMRTDYIDTWMLAAQERYRLQAEGYAAATLVAVLSESARTDCLRLLGLTPARVRTVPGPAITARADRMPAVGNGTPAGRDASGILGRLGLSRNNYFVYCSGSGANKNIERQMDGFLQFTQRRRQQRYPVIPLVIAGSQPEDAALRLKARAFDAGLTREELILSGYVSDDDLRVLQSGARALLSATLYEGYGLPAAEAMAAGIPVIASATSSYPEVVGDAGLLVDPLDPNAIAIALSKLAEDDALRATLSKHGRERARTLFAPGRQAQAYLALYAEAARS